MITFVSLFLGLVLGTHTLTLTVSDPILRVEIVVDGSSVGIVDGAPWSFELDFGDRLVPHELLAVGYDASGDEVDRARQWLNLPRQAAETVIAMQGDPKDGDNRTAKLTWESLAGQHPTDLRVTFDDRPVAVSDPNVIPLPEHDPAQLHFLRAELDFADGVSSHAELVFGGDQLEHISSELTPVPIEPIKSKKIPPAETASGWFAVSGKHPEVVAWEEGSADVVMVPSLGSLEELHRIRNQEMSKPLPSSAWRRSVLFGSQDWQLRMIWPMSRRNVGMLSPFDLFAHSAPPASESGNVLRWITEIEPPPELNGSPRLADAVAVAGVTAAGMRGRRAVVLILGGEDPDTSRLSPSQVREYLHTLRVPLQVWSTRLQGNAASPWGPAIDISSPGQLQKAMNQLLDSLERQQVVWLAGYHLPQKIALTPQAKGIRLVE